MFYVSYQAFADDKHLLSYVSLTYNVLTSVEVCWLYFGAEQTNKCKISVLKQRNLKKIEILLQMRGIKNANSSVS